jgi:hypothetical protein
MRNWTSNENEKGISGWQFDLEFARFNPLLVGITTSDVVCMVSYQTEKSRRLRFGPE